MTLVRVPFYSGKLNKDVDRTKPDERDLEEVDPLFRIPRDQTIRFRVGAPQFFQDIGKQEYWSQLMDEVPEEDKNRFDDKEGDGKQ